MGLDSYILAKRYVKYWGFDDSPKQDQNAQLAKAVNGVYPTPPGFELRELSYQVAYWRKANAIHQWFVANVQGGVDECQETWIAPEALKELRDMCADLLVDRDETKARLLLPTAEGFFFGSTEYDEDYWADVSDALDQLDRILAVSESNPGEFDFYYQASW